MVNNKANVIEHLVLVLIMNDKNYIVDLDYLNEHHYPYQFYMFPSVF